MKIGFIGLGIMGKPMCKNLLKAGHRCTVYDIMETAMDEVAAAGAIKSRSAAEAAGGKELVITMLPNSPHVRQVVMEENGIMASELHLRNDRHSVFAESKCELPALDDFYSRFVHIPCGWWVDDTERERIVALIRKGW